MVDEKAVDSHGDVTRFVKLLLVKSVLSMSRESAQAWSFSFLELFAFEIHEFGC